MDLKIVKFCTRDSLRHGNGNTKDSSHGTWQSAKEIVVAMIR